MLIINAKFGSHPTNLLRLCTAIYIQRTTWWWSWWWGHCGVVPCYCQSNAQIFHVDGHVVKVGGRGEGAVWHGHVLGDNCYWCLIKKKSIKKKVKYLLIFSIWIGLWFIHKWTINIQDCCGSSRMFSYCSQHTYCRQTFFGKVGARFKSTNSIKPTKINIYLYLNFRLGYDFDRIAYPT